MAVEADRGQPYLSVTAAHFSLQLLLSVCPELFLTGMLMWGALADIVGRRLGSRTVASIMFASAVLLIFTPFVTSPSGYFAYFMVAQTL